MEFLERVIKVAILRLFQQFRPKILSYVNQIIKEPLFWIIVAIFIGLAIIGIIVERREKKSKQRHTPNETEGYSDKKGICHYCRGYGELVTKNKGKRESTTCQHCSGTGWAVERNMGGNMGLAKWWARKGNVGGTARAVANGWVKIREENPEIRARDIAEIYVNIRYMATEEPHLAEKVLNSLPYDANPLNLSWTIFYVENEDESDTVLAHMSEWVQIMREEIGKYGLEPGKFFLQTSREQRSTESSNVLRCPHCGSGFNPTDYRQDVSEWRCSQCGKVLPKE